MEGKDKREMEREREIQGEKKSHGDTENKQRRKSAQRNAHTEGSQKAAEGKFKKAQTSEKHSETTGKERRGRQHFRGAVVVVLGEIGAWKRGCEEPGEDLLEGNI